MDGNNVSPGGGCPVMHGGNTESGAPVTKWWPNALNLDILHQHGARTNPMDPGYDHREAVKALDFEAVKADVKALMLASEQMEDVSQETLDALVDEFEEECSRGPGLVDSSATLQNLIEESVTPEQRAFLEEGPQATEIALKYLGSS